MAVGAVWITFVVALLAWAIRRSLRQARARQRLLDQGEPVEAVLLDFKTTTDTAWRSHGQYVEARLEVRPALGAPYEARTVFFLANLDVPRYQPGTAVTAYRDRADPARVALEDTPHFEFGMRRKAP